MTDDNGKLTFSGFSLTGIDRISGSLGFNHEARNWLHFACGLRINTATGEVVIPDGLSLDDAARAFWQAVSRLVPMERKSP